MPDGKDWWLSCDRCDWVAMAAVPESERRKENVVLMPKRPARSGTYLLIGYPEDQEKR